MFPKTLLVFIVLFLSAFTAQAVPVASVAECATPSVSIRTVTVTVSAAAAATSVSTSDVPSGTSKQSSNSKGRNRHNSGGSHKADSSTTLASSTDTVSSTAAASTSTSSSSGNNGGSAVPTGGASSTASAPPAATSSANAGGDPQTSLTLDPAVIATGFENNGQNVPAAGQVASATSPNNFMNFCLTVPQLPITNGKQIATGSCNPAPMGILPSTANMPSSKFTFPKNFGTIKANTPFTISMAIQGMEAGFFVNAEENYFSAPQQLNAQGQVKGHSHVVVESLSSLAQTTTTNPTRFAFFKGMNTPAQNGILTADVAAGLPAGVYKLSSINSAANHQPILVPIAQHGSLDDFIYFTVTDSGVAAANSTGAATSTASSGASSSTVTASSAATSSTVSAVTSSSTGVSASATASSTTDTKASTISSATVATASPSTSDVATSSTPGRAKATPVPPIAAAPASTSSAALKGSGKN